MSSVTLMPVAEYLRLSEKPAREYREGVLFPKAMPVKAPRVGSIAVDQQPPPARSGSAGRNLRFACRSESISSPMSWRRGPSRTPYPTEPVLLCCEILSPEDRLGGILAKCEEYHAWGVPFCWVIDPVKKAAWEYHLGGEPVRVASHASLRAVSWR